MMLGPKWRLKLIVLSTVLAMLLAACGDTGDNGDDPDDGEDPTSAEGPLGFDSNPVDYVEAIGAAVDEDIGFLDVCPSDDGDAYPIAYRTNGFIAAGPPEAIEALVGVVGLEVQELAVISGTTFAKVRQDLRLDDEEGFRQGELRSIPDALRQLLNRRLDNDLPDAFDQLSIGLDHVHLANPITRGHPVDEPDPASTHGEHVPPVAGDSGSVAVIDAEPNKTHALDQHGAFIVSLINSMGVEATLYPAENISTDPDMLLFDDRSVIAAIGEAATGEHDVINLSLGAYACPGFEPMPLLNALSLLENEGMSVVASAGNDGSSQHTYPAAAFIGVGSVNKARAQSCFSNHGDWVRYWVVGEEVLAGYSDLANGATWSGTSFAAPQVAAQLAAGLDPTPIPPEGSDLGDDPDGHYGCP